MNKAILIICILLFFTQISFVIALPNPSAFYCQDMGYTFKVITKPDGSQTGICVFPDNSSCDSWDFYAGLCGKKHSYCTKKGYVLKSVIGDEDKYSPIYSVCFENKKKIGVTSKLTNMDKRMSSYLAPDVVHSTSTAGFEIQATPDYFDWRTKDGNNWMTSVKDQNPCGSCWAFSSLGTVEAQYNIASNNPNLDLDLSEENLVSDCFPFGSCCGLPFSEWQPLFEYIKNIGVVDESCFPYVDNWDGTTCSCSDGTCDANCVYNTKKFANCSDKVCTDRCPNWSSKLHNIFNFTEIPANKESIKSYLVQNGPVATAMYWGGIVDINAKIITCSPDAYSGSKNHFIIITGYNETGDYWIVRNSWGANWPLPNGDGYFKVGFGECSIEDMAYGVNVCSCSEWSASTCGSGSCAATERRYVRSCTPSGCDEEEKCEYDETCLGGVTRTVCKLGCTYSKIKDALAFSIEGDRVLVTDSQEYFENINWPDNNYVTLDCQNATLNGQGTYSVAIRIDDGEDEAVIKNCNFQGYTSSAIEVDSSEYDSNLCQFKENSFINNNKAIYFLGGVYQAKIENNIFDSNNIGIEFEYYSLTRIPRYNTIKNNIFTRNTNKAINFMDTMIGQNNLESNLIKDNFGYGIYIVSSSSGPNTFSEINSNTISNNSYGVYINEAEQNTINNNIFCPSNINYDLSVCSGNSGDNNVCEKPNGWNDAGTTGCTYRCLDYCTQNSDCGTTGWVGQPFCLEKEVWQNWTSPICNNAGQLDSFCTYETEPVLKEECEYSCENGFCLYPDFNLSLAEGWNLISSPLNFSNISKNFDYIKPSYSSMFGYDGLTQKYVKLNPFNGSEEIDLRYGAWIEVIYNTTLPIFGDVFQNINIPLFTGWNLIGHLSINEENINDSNLKNRTMFAYINNSWSTYIPNRTSNSLQTLKPGHGYWVWN